MLEYLIFRFNIKKLSPKSILVHRNALAEPLRIAFNISTEDKVFKMLSKSFFNKRPPPRHIMPQWSIQKVLNLLKAQRFGRQANILDRLKKTIFLTALATGNRVSEISAMRRHALFFSDKFKKVTIPVAPNFLYKNQVQNRAPPNIEIQALDPKKSHILCPVANLRKYLDITKADKRNQSIFVNTQSGGNLKASTSSKLLSIPHLMTLTPGNSQEPTM